MVYLSVNYLLNYGRQVYSTCTSLRDRTLAACQQIGQRARYEAYERGVPLVYRIAHPRLFNIIFRLLAGVSIEETKNKELHLAARLGTTRDVAAILAKGGADVNAKNWKGETPLHLTALKGNSAGCRLLLEKGAKVDSHTSVGASTPLHLAVRRGKTDVVRTLVAAGADMNARNSDGLIPLQYAQSIEIARILLDVESHPAFASITTLHDYCDKMFPASRNELPKDWETWLKKIKRGKDPFKELGEVFAKCGQMSFEKNLETLEKTLQGVPSVPPTLESIVEYLIHDSPVFAKAWALVNRDGKLNLIEITTDFGIGNQKFAPAYYDGQSHAININKHLDIDLKTYFVIFELMNALQRESRWLIEQLAKHGELSREEYALLIEHLEYATLCWTHRITGISLPDNFNFAEVWKLHNIPPQVTGFKGLSPHADTYRTIWDFAFAAQYFKKHPEMDIAFRKSWNSNRKTSRP